MGFIKMDTKRHEENISKDCRVYPFPSMLSVFSFSWFFSFKDIGYVIQLVLMLQGLKTQQNEKNEEKRPFMTIELKI